MRTRSRREFLQAGAVAMMAGEFGARPTSAAVTSPNASRPNPRLASVKALVFDVFGTVVDWRTSVAQEVAALAKRKNLTVDGAKFADAWRAGYGPSMNQVRTGELPWTRLDGLHRMILDKILIDFGIAGLSESETDALNRAWHRLRPCTWAICVPRSARGWARRWSPGRSSTGRMGSLT